MPNLANTYSNPKNFIILLIKITLEMLVDCELYLLLNSGLERERERVT